MATAKDASKKKDDEKIDDGVWLTVIDFAKLNISLASSILTILIGYLVLTDKHTQYINFIFALPFSAAIILSVYGFGHAIAALRDSTDSKSAISLCNYGAGFLLIGILALFFIRHDDRVSIDHILKDIGSTASMYHVQLQPDKCRYIEATSDGYLLKYYADGTEVDVNYSKIANAIIQIKEQPELKP